MGMQIDKSSYEKLIREDIEWLEANTEHSCERMHIEDVLKCSVCMIYGEQTSLCSRLNCKTPKRKDGGKKQDEYEIFAEKCRDEGIEPPTFEEYKNRR